jgi:8-oxo-dGTP pyrophosphatase MutT (NUDIX family)
MAMNAPIQKAGAIVMRVIHGEPYIYIVHRHRYNDWSLPKGHIDEGETLEEAALREIEEETGMQCRILDALPEYSYELPDGQMSVVAMFLMELVQVTGNIDETEVDMGRWVTIDEAIAAMSYPSIGEYLQMVRHDIAQFVVY